MDICVSCAWQLEMNDVIDRGNIKTSSSNIRSYQDTVGRGSKTEEKGRSEVTEVLKQANTYRSRFFSRCFCCNCECKG